MAAWKSEDPSAWSDLPPELLGTVLRSLPSLADRVRLRAVCRRWRNSAIVFPPSHLHLPWLAFIDGTLLDVVNNAAHRVRIPDDAVCYSAGENTFFLVHDDGRCSLVDLFYGGTGTATPLPELAALLRASKVDPRYELLQPVHKVVVSTSSAELEEDCRLVAVIIRGGNVIISTCRPAGEANACLALDNYFNFSIADIMFFQGRMYALAKVHEALQAVDLNKGRIDQLPAPRPPGIEVIPGAASAEFEMIQEPHLQEDPWPYGHEVAGRYLVESNGKLLMIRRWIRKPLMSFSYYAMTEFHDADGYDLDRTRRFEVFEIGHRQWNSRRRWHKVQSLHGQALFVSSPCSKAAPAADHGAQQDCIYFSHQFCRRKMDDPLGDSGVYSMRDGTITRPLLPEPAAVSASLPWLRRFPTWVFPVEA